ncbi:MAG: hypothetical protein F8N39_11740 [Clostridiaceae bacterium]|nr:hypothetical protein [Clostridiaceae bacterium]
MKIPYILAILLAVSAPAMAQQQSSGQVKDMKIVSGETSSISYIEGIFTNTTGKTLNVVSLQFNLYDKQEIMVGNAAAIGNNITAGGVWKFRAIAVIPYDHATLSGINSF